MFLDMPGNSGQREDTVVSSSQNYGSHSSVKQSIDYRQLLSQIDQLDLSAGKITSTEVRPK